ncbi:MAG TPA: hypothetical protein VLF60_04085 [Candidatus Saccharimonadales bacterium]|nr:hypothetical protein [Candidatus Saccharimonadales bacterium]
MKKKFIPLLICGALLALGVVGIVAKYATHYLQTKSDAQAASLTCAKTGTAHQVTITHNVMQPARVLAKRCDTLTITNTDDVLREIAFGAHEHHEAYNNVSEQPLQYGQRFTITLNQTGDYTFHDHLHDEVTGEFTVAE